MGHKPEFVKICEDAKSQIQEINVNDVFEMQQNQEKFTLIDVREENEWIMGHLPEAIHLSKGIIERDIEKVFPDKNEKIILYCGGGYRSALSAYNLQKMGFTKIFSMAGGIRAWRDQNYPIQKD